MIWFRKSVLILLTLSSCTLSEVNFNPEPLVESPAKWLDLSTGQKKDLKQDSESQSKLEVGKNKIIANSSDFEREKYSSESKNIDFPLKELQPWWHYFDNPKLSELIEMGLSGGFNLEALRHRIEQSRAILKRTATGLFPDLSLGAESGAGLDNDGRSSETVAAGVFSVWDADLFGSTRASILAREADSCSAEELYRLGVLSLSVEIARNYFGAVEQIEQLDLLSKQISVDRQFLELVDLRVIGGLASSVDLLQQRRQLSATESLVPLAEMRLWNFENILDVLVGQNPDGIARIEKGQRLRVDKGAPLSLGSPVDTILARPDLAARRYQLISADAEIGRAIADRYPSVRFDLGYGYRNNDSDSGFTGTFLINFVQPLIDWGARKAEVTRNQALYRERLADYTDSVLRAVYEVEESRFTVLKQLEFLALLERRVLILDETLEETTARYSQGLTDYLPVLDAARELRNLSREVVLQRRLILNEQIRLHQALGGPVPPVVGRDAARFQSEDHGGEESVTRSCQLPRISQDFRES